MTRVLISDAIEQGCVDALKQEGFTVDVRTGLPKEELKKIIADYDVLVVRSSTKVTADIIAAASKLRVIGRAGAGVDNIDVEASTRKGIVVMNTPGGNTVSTAEHTMSLLLSMARNIPQANLSLREGKWERGKFLGTELIGKTIGILGLGKVGREVATRCQAFGMTTIGFDPLVSAEVATKLNIGLVPLEEIFRRSDFITVHTPLNEETRGLVGEKQFAACKKGVRIINCARGGIVDEQALLKALDAGIVASAAVDVFEQEPPKESALVRHPRVVATPHLGASTEEAQEKVARQIAVQIADYLKERGMAGAVNAEAIRMAMRGDLKPFVQLAERMGMLQSQLMSGKLKSMTVTCSGPLLSSSLEMVTAGVLKGIFSAMLSEPVNLVNASVIAKELGLTVRQQLEAESGSYTHLIKLSYESDAGPHLLSGTVFGSASGRIVQVDDYLIELSPEGHMLFYRNIDRPGMLATVGSVLASSGINIGGLSLGRVTPGEKALTVINVDSAIPGEIIEKLRGIEGVFDVRSVHLV